MIEYVPDDGLVKALTAMLDPETYPEFAAIINNQVKVGCCLKVQTDKEGELKECKTEPVLTKRIGQAERLYSQVDAILIVDAYAWQTGGADHMKALLHRGLMRLDVEVKDGNVKTKTRKPDIVEHSQTVKRFAQDCVSFEALAEIVPSVSERLLAAASETPPEAEPEPAEQPQAVNA